MKGLAISGSLRVASKNTALLRAVAQIAPSNITIELYRDLGKLPLFNPDLENDPPQSVISLCEKLMTADAVLIASPEYAHGVTGAIKNALDWMVSTEAFINKPVALLNASPRAVHAHKALRETITVMSGLVIDEASITLAIVGSDLDEAAMVADPLIVTAVLAALRALQVIVE